MNTELSTFVTAKNYIFITEINNLKVRRDEFTSDEFMTKLNEIVENIKVCENLTMLAIAYPYYFQKE